MRKYPQCTVNIEATQNQKIALFTDEEIRTILNIAEKKLEGRGRVVVRPSGTEPLIRIMVEGEDKEDTARIADGVASRLKARLRDY